MYLCAIIFEQRMKYKKSLGQHFLINEEKCQEIVNLLPKIERLSVLEVGPGGGALTKYLLKIPNIHYKAIEADPDKVTYLNQHFPSFSDSFHIGSFLDMEPPFEEPFIVIGNFPYNISSPIMFKILEWKGLVTHVVGMFQKEVAKRIVANEGTKDYGILSVFTERFFDRHYHFDVPPHDFMPAPKVNSGVIRLDYSGDKFDIKNEKTFKQFVKLAFSQRRKTLRNVFKSSFDPQELTDDFYNLRIEQVSIQQLVSLYKKRYES